MFGFLNSLWYRIRSRFDRDALDAELAEEMRLHEELLREDARRGGASEEQAKREAAFRFGNATNARERARASWSLGFIEALLQDTRYAARFLRRSPGFTAVAILSLALGIGANATVFAVADRLLFSAPPHVANVEGLYMVNVKRVATGSVEDRPFHAATMFPEYFALREQARSLAVAAVYTPPERVRLGRGPDAPRIKESTVSVNFFDVLGVRPFKGRLFLAEDDSETRADRAAVISYEFWQRQFGGAESALGARIITSGLEFVIVGVAPKEFTGVELDAADVWAPLGATAPSRIGADWKQWSGFSPRILVRLADGVVPTAAAAEATVIFGRVQDAKKRGKTDKTVVLGSVIQARGPAEQTTAVKVSTRLVFASVLVLLAACANLANLLLVRALTRRREIALRLAIGVSRVRLASQMLLESLLIALAGAVAALIAARWSGAALRSLVFPEMQWASGTVSVRVFAYAVLCGTAVAVLATIVPAIRMTRNDVGAALRSAAPQLTASTGRLRQGLLALQVALSVLLIVGATAFSRSLARAYAFDMGVDVDRVMTARFGLESDSLNGTSRMVMMEEAARRARLVPGVERATVAQAVPLTGNSVVPLRIPERELEKVYALKWDITPELQETIGIRLTQGRLITSADVGVGMPAVTLLSETAASKLWPGANALGRCVRLVSDTMPCLQVVGVFRDVRSRSIRDEPAMSMLVGTAKADLGGFFSGYIVMRLAKGANPATIIAPLRATLRDVRADVSSLEVRSLAKALDTDYRPLKLGAATFGSFALLAIILSAVGLYGILAFSVAQRTSEFGIRSALGARASHLIRNIVGEGLAIVAAGLAVGVLLSWYASTTIAALLFEASARDAMPYVFAVITLGVVALAASAIPAWRATRIDPASALRAE